MTLPYDHAGYVDECDTYGLVLRKSDIFRALLLEGRKTTPKHATGLQFPVSRFAGRQAGRRGGVSNAPSRHKDTARAGA